MNKRSLIPILVLTLVALLLGSAPVVASPPAAQGDWWGDYFANATLSGAPAMSRFDGAINFNWGLGSPGSGLPSDDFSVRWERDEWFGGGTYRFEVYSDDGVRIWVGDQLIVDEWHDRPADPLFVDRYVPAGVHRVRVEYYEHSGAAIINARWSRVVGGETWRAEYFNTRDLAGAPVLIRNDGAIDFDWGNGSPDPAVNADDFSARWVRTLNFNAGTYRFLASTDDGVRIWVDSGLVVNAWEDQPLYKINTGEVYLADGQHTITVEYFEHIGSAGAHVWWQLADTEVFTAWHGEYFDNPDLVGGPALERNDAEVNFDWGVGPPVSWMPDDNFSARWTRTVSFSPGYYRFVLRADDGARLWVGQRILIDKWQDMDNELHYVDGTYLQETHTVRLEYFEHTGHARVQFWWESGTNDNAPPSCVPAPATGAGAAPAAEADDPWMAAYFANTDLSGKPVLTRVETALNHNWGLGSPGAGVPKDQFSARWTQPLYFRAGTYRFTTYTDDGVRLWVDGKLLIDSWRAMRGYRSATVHLSEGVHEVQMEYHERTGAALARLTWQRISR
jgi:hypothetical protein